MKILRACPNFRIFEKRGLHAGQISEILRFFGFSNAVLTK